MYGDVKRCLCGAMKRDFHRVTRHLTLSNKAIQTTLQLKLDTQVTSRIKLSGELKYEDM